MPYKNWFRLEVHTAITYCFFLPVLLLEAREYAMRITHTIKDQLSLFRYDSDLIMERILVHIFVRILLTA